MLLLAGYASCALRRRTVLQLDTSDDAEAAGLPRFFDVEGGLPDRDLAAAHDPDLDAAPVHLGARLRVLPIAFPVVRDGVAHQGAKFLAQAIAVLAGAAGSKEFRQRILAAELRQIAEAHHAILGEARENALDVPGHEQGFHV